ncbi:Cystathionine gamma-synthase [Balamuthia mandrillaris]
MDKAKEKGMPYGDYGFGTRAIHAGQPPDPVTGAVIVPISMATTFQQSSPGVHQGYDYSRSGNPTRLAYENNVAACENAKYGIAMSSGSATTVTILHLLSKDDHVVAMDDCYGGTYRYFTKVATPMGLNFTLIDFNVEGALEGAITPKTKLIWMETPTNPMLKIVDIAKVAEIAKKNNLLLVVDNTFMSPYFQNPLDLGADMVMHSVSKYINGHSDVIGGIVCTNNEQLHTRLRFLQNSIGAVPSPMDCFLITRGMKTLHVRMRQHEANAIEIAKFLEAHDKIEKVVYPGLPTHPQHELAKKQMKGFGGMVTFYVKGGLEGARTLLSNLKIIALAESLGACESLIESPAIMTHASVPPEERAKLGISDSLCRLSVGIEDVEDLLADLASALDKVEC